MESQGQVTMALTGASESSIAHMMTDDKASNSMINVGSLNKSQND